jgi:diguanylate cyclase (GGDEF)-like protein
MNHFLLVEDSPIVSKIVRHVLKHHTDLACETASSLQEAEQLLARHGAEYFLAAVVDLNLPDSPNGEIVGAMTRHKLPTIVLTGNFDSDKRNTILDQGVVDYVIKESRFSYEYVIKLVQRLKRNRQIKILVADDSSTSRNYICNLLKTHLFQVVSADDGDTALTMIQNDPEIRLLITDYNMPRMNGFDLVRAIRRETQLNELVIIGLSGEGDSRLSAKFIKNGANDFLTKPFSHEEFFCRVMQDIENMEHLQTMRHMAYHDYVTGLPNKRMFFERGNEELNRARQKGTHVSLSLISVDRMDRLHDRYGIDATELVMRTLASLLPKAFERFLYARISDSEIAVLMAGLTLEQATKLIESFREIVEDHIVLMDGSSFNFTISAGIAEDREEKLITLLQQADNRLFAAREIGDNQVCAGDGLNI